jgi:hypothetical protein
VHNRVAPFTSHGKLHEFGAEKPISSSKPTNFDFFTIHCIVWTRILRTGGDALTLSQKNTLILIGMKNPNSHLKNPDLAS